MSDRMRQIPFEHLMDWILTEYELKDSIFGVKKLYKKTGDEPQAYQELFGEKLEIPFGPAAGPHTQLAQNIVAAYVAGGRFFELKTVQVLDGEDLPVSKPCILAPDECYNVEWSTELRVPQALDEYIKAWFAIKLLSQELGLGHPDGFIFNMSVGYDLEGIKTKKIDDFIEGLKNAENTEAWDNCMKWARDNVRRFNNLNKSYVEDISPCVSESITLSTLHGCLPEEIERIAAYLLTEKKLHTFIKCNPTLVGYEYARKAMDDLGFGYVSFDDHHFKADLKFEDAVPMLRKLQALADSLSLAFGVKLTNTFPVRITKNELPGEEMYMSGRSLFPLSIEAANRLSKAFDVFGEKLRISYSGGADIFNIDKIYEAGIWPITLCTTLLKPGGYQKLGQFAEKLQRCGCKPFVGADLEKLQRLSESSLSDPMYQKRPNQQPKPKTKGPLPLLDCAMCKLCADVCPNRANIAVTAGGQQIVHADFMCNECGNCTMFCPHSGAPYKDKFTLFACEEDFENSENQGFMPLSGGAVRVRVGGKTADHRDGSGLPAGIWDLIEAVIEEEYIVKNI